MENNQHIPHPKKAAMIKALEACLGVVTDAARMVGIDRGTHYDWLKKDSDYKAKVDEITEVSLDFAESHLHKQIREGDTTAIIFFLKTKGKKRGYIERQEIDHSGQQKVIIQENRSTTYEVKANGLNGQAITSS